MNDYLINNSIPQFINQSSIVNLQSKITQAQKYDADYIELENRQKELQITNKLMKKHKQKRSANQAVIEVRDRARNRTEIQKWLTDLKKWGINSYRLIVSIRELITGQRLVYHIMDSNHRQVFELNEEQYLDLISQKNLDFGGRGGWASIKKALNTTNPANLADLFEFRVDTTMKREKNQTALQSWVSQQGEGIIRRNINNDTLYNYLLSRHGEFMELQTKSGKASHAAIFELYDQLYSTYIWKKSANNRIVKFTGDNTTEGFSNQRKIEMDIYISNYMADLSKNKSDTFYAAGDTTQDENTLIENKVRGATVSLKTIKEAIHKIANLNIGNISQIKTGLKEIFLSRGQGFFQQIRKAAYDKAIKSIDDLFIVK